MTRLPLLAAAVAAFGLAAQPADAASYPRSVGSGENAEIVYGPGPQGNIVGGGRVVIQGGPTNIELRHLDPEFAQAPRQGLMPRVIGSGTVVLVPADTGSTELKMLGQDGSLPRTAAPAGRFTTGQDPFPNRG